jgi:hypothetical protein
MIVNVTPFRRPIFAYSDDGRSFLDRRWCIEAVTMPSTCFPAVSPLLNPLFGDYSAFVAAKLTSIGEISDYPAPGGHVVRCSTEATTS